jgi:hypothetical protein
VLSATVSCDSFAAKVGLVVSPYAAVYSTSVDSPGLDATQFTHNFTSTYGDTGAGIAFTMYAYSATTVCFDNVSLVRR